MKRSLTQAFTLVELLAVTAILAILAAILVPVVDSCIKKARATREIAGARRAILAWRACAAENNQMLLPGYQADWSAVNATGKALSFPANARYVFRLAPYLDFQIKGTLLVNDQTRIKDDYEISMAPSLGINLTFVGGDYGGGSDLVPSDANFARYGKFAVTNLNEIHAPSRLLVFASARITDSRNRTQEGYNAIKSPRFFSNRWPVTYDEKRPYYDFGAVHPRFQNRAVCAMADGHVEMLGLEELRDMRRWSNQAALADDPDWTLQTL